MPHKKLMIKWCSMEEMAKLSDLPIPQFKRLLDNRVAVVGDYCVAYIDHGSRILSLNLINRIMPHPQIELFFTYLHEQLHILNWKLLRRKIIDKLIDFIEERIFQKTIYKIWRKQVKIKETTGE